MVKFSLILLVILTAKFCNAQGSICTYDFNEIGTYRCTIRDQIILDEESMLPVGGTHLPGYGDQNVTVLTSSNSTIRVFPSLIIDTFVNLRDVVLVLTTNTFNSTITNCEHLERLSMPVNVLPSFGGGIFRNCSRLTTMRLPLSSIVVIEDNAFDGLTSLESLFLSSNLIRNLNSNIFASLTSLSRLELDGNQIEELAPGIFGSSPLLRTLILRNNRISSWNSTILLNNTMLTTLDLSQNMIRSFDGNAFSSLQNLLTLTIGHALEEIPTFSNLDNLQILSLDNNNILHVSADSFRNLPNLRDLTLSRNRIESVDFTMRSDRFLTKLERLDIWNNFIMTIQDNAFTMLENLIDLDLSSNYIERLNENSIRPIVQMRRLNVGFNRLQTIERALFDGVANLEFRSASNVCFNGNLNITNVYADYADFEDRVVPLLNPCFNFATITKINPFVFVFSFVLIISSLANL